jgi:hypothetical protein
VKSKLLEFVAILAILATPLVAQTNADLRQQLAASEDARRALAASVSKLATQQAAQQPKQDVANQAAAAANRAAVAGRQEAAQERYQDATAARVAAEVNANVAQQAAAVAMQTALAATAAAATAKAQASAVLYTQVIGFATLLVGFVWKAYTEARDRRWALADAQNHGREVLGKIAEVKVAADSAYNEANTVNHKIESIGLKLNAPGQLKPDDHPADKPAIKE